MLSTYYIHTFKEIWQNFRITEFVFLKQGLTRGTIVLNHRKKHLFQATTIVQCKGYNIEKPEPI